MPDLKQAEDQRAPPDVTIWVRGTYSQTLETGSRPSGARIMKKHEWREKTEEGETRLVTATRHAGKWQLRSRLKKDDDWTLHSAIPLDDLETLHEIISKKYQRQRVPFEHISEIEALIKSAKPRKQ